MADPTNRWPDNAPGIVFVDDGCICCAACLACAPEHFDYSDDGDHVRVVLQPTDQASLDACREAASVCPVDAIGGTEDR